MRRTGESESPNPFVVLSDLTIAVLLMLILYFAALFVAFQRQLVEAGKEKDPTTRLIEKYQQDVTEHLWNQELNASDKKLIGMRIDKKNHTQYFTFPASTLFVPDHPDLDPKLGGEQLLMRFGKALGRTLKGELHTVEGRKRLYPEIQVQGHTDSSFDPQMSAQQRDEHNWDLSGQRALNVVKILRRCDPLQQEKLSLAGYAYFQPSAHSRLILGAQQAENRRVEIRLLYALDIVH